ncbi:MAG TPA: ribbon-helix-helix protein, CopG family [Candidatus Limnocylindrales bacterium]|jgi:hypothetical protein|nr:ribbon-helix-helix protein, CopG family [Candidatus Limnocylindrales bacterium]
MPAKRVLISIDERLLDRIDEACERRGVSRSAYLAQLADADLLGGAGPGADPSVRAALASIDELVGRAAP